MLEAIQKQIENYKQTLETLPTNTKENRDKCLEYIHKLQDVAKHNREVFKKEITTRKEKLSNVNSNPMIQTLEQKLLQFDILSFSKEVGTPYEKLELDQYLYEIGHFYNENLENINQDILTCLKILNDVGIVVQDKDFTYSTFASLYMKGLLENHTTAHQSFEEIFWKCPELFNHIGLNIRSIYLKNESKIAQVLEERTKNCLQQLGLTQQQLFPSYCETRKNLETLQKQDPKLLLDRVLEEKLSLTTLAPSSIQKIYQKYHMESMENENRSNIVKQLYNNVLEYKGYLQYQYIMEDVKKKFQDKNNNKKAYEGKKKEINKAEKELEKLNSKMNSLVLKKGGLGQSYRETKLGKISYDINSKIMELKKLYEELDQVIIIEQLQKHITEDTTLYEVISFAASFDHYMIDLLKQQDNTRTMEDYKNEVKNVKDFVRSPYHTILYNITILDERDVKLLIQDRYRMMGIEVTEDSLNPDNLDTLLQDMETLLESIYLEKSGWKIEELEFLKKEKQLEEK